VAGGGGWSDVSVPTSFALTGSYNNFFNIYDLANNGKNDAFLQADKNAFKSKRNGTGAKNKLLGRGGSNSARLGRREDVNVDAIDFGRKILHASWHPFENTIAIAATNNLFIFT
jgi:serine/threonine-protein phosphatase 2A regulatory subunit B